MRVLNALSLALLLGLLSTSPALAQQGSNADDGRPLSVSAMDAALASHELAADQHRTQLAELLSARQVRELASERGIDMERVESMADGLSDGELAGLAPLVTAATAAMQDGGGLGTVTLSVAAIIIILLILILVT
jgi:hypothetical protein